MIVKVLVAVVGLGAAVGGFAVATGATPQLGVPKAVAAVDRWDTAYHGKLSHLPDQCEAGAAGCFEFAIRMVCQTGWRDGVVRAPNIGHARVAAQTRGRMYGCKDPEIVCRGEAVVAATQVSTSATAAKGSCDASSG